MKLNFSGLTIEQAMRLIPARRLVPWQILSTDRPASDILQGTLHRLQSFELFTSEAAKLSLIDALLLEIVPLYSALKVWKAEPLEAESVAGVADYLIAPKLAYVETPLLCAIEAKRDDFVKGQIQCIAEMAACRENNLRDNHVVDVYGIVSSGQVWVFYKLSPVGEVFVSSEFVMSDLPKLLGVLDFVCAACAQNVP